MFIRFDRMYERVGHTDRQTWHTSIGRACIASRGNKCGFVQRIVANTPLMYSFSHTPADTAGPRIRSSVSCDSPVYSPVSPGTHTSLPTEGEVRLSGPGCLVLRRGGLPVFSSMRGRQQLSCRVLRFPNGPNNGPLLCSFNVSFFLFVLYA